MQSDNVPKMIIFCAPSGSGKTTIANKVMGLIPLLSFSVSATNRLPRMNEKDGLDYHFLSTEEFENKIASGDFLEYEEVYPSKFYGTLKSEVERLHSLHKVPVFDIDVKGAKHLKDMYGDSVLMVFIKVPMDIIEKRLIERNTETLETLAVRINKIKEEMTYEPYADKVVMNIDLDEAVHKCTGIIKDFLHLS